MMGDKFRVVFRFLVLGLLFFLPRLRRRKIERWLRGREEFKKLQRADWVLVSWGKSGRTWFRVMLSRFYQQRFDIPTDILLEFDNYHSYSKQAQSVFFTHNNYLRDYTGDHQSKAHFSAKRVVLLVRDPRDVAVSQFFQWKFRMRPRKKYLNSYPEHGADISIYDFVMGQSSGLSTIIDFLNDWAAALDMLGPESVLMVRYEDLRTHPEQEMQRILDFVGMEPGNDEITEAVKFAAYQNMKKMEQEQHFKGSGARVKAGDESNPQSFKVRRAKVGGYRDYFDDDEIQAIDRLVIDTLNPLFAYAGQPVSEPQKIKAEQVTE